MVCAYLASIRLVLLWQLYASNSTLQEDREDTGGLPNPGRNSEGIRVCLEHWQVNRDCSSMTCHKLCCKHVDLLHKDIDALLLFCLPASV